MDLGLSGKTALVLGGGGGLGRAIATVLAREGARVALGDVSAAALEAPVHDIESAGGQALGVTWDLSDLGAIDAAISRIEARFGPVDVLVNNTGGPPPTPAAGQEPGLWVKHFQAMVLSVIRQIVQEHPSCVMLKHEDWPGLEKISALRRFEAEGSLRHVSILCGNGGLFLDFEMERGADGAMTGYAFPDMLVDVVKLAKADRRADAHDLFDSHLPLVRYEQQQGVGLAVRKYVLQKRGSIASDTQRKPATTLSAAARAEVEFLLARLARHDARARL